MCMAPQSLPEIGFLSDVSAGLKEMLSQQATEIKLAYPILFGGKIMIEAAHRSRAQWATVLAQHPR